MKITVELTFKTALRWLLGLLLVWAALSKLANPQDFYGQLLAYRLPLPETLLKLVAITLPWVEMLCGLILLARFRTEAALLWCMALFLSFTLATGQAWARGLEISCGCLNLRLFGLAGEHAGLTHFFESVGFAFWRAVLLAAGAVYLWRQHQALPPASPEVDEGFRTEGAEVQAPVSRS